MRYKKQSLFKQYLIVVASVFLLTTFGCQPRPDFLSQNFAAQSDDWKQDKIATMYKKYAQEFSKVEGITVEELQKLQHQANDLILIDVRSPTERKVSMIPGAITKDEFERNLEQYKNATIVAYCTIGYRSGKYAEKWRQQGVKILNLEGSLLAWSHVRGKLIDATGSITNKVHVFGRQWQLTADDYQPIW